MSWNTIASKEDESVNFIKKYKNGLLECRYVRRVDDYFIVYLSSHSGCNFSCRFCHLTATSQTSFDGVDVENYIDQATTVLNYYSSLGYPAEKVHFNFMARGEPLANTNMIENGKEIISILNNLAKERNLYGSCRISTIIPNTINKPLEEIIGIEGVIPYYSLYSVNENFRKRWIPKSLPVVESLDILKEWQNKSGEYVVIHGAFIKNENDSKKDINDICDMLIEKKIICKMNIVRYNPFSEKHGEETSEENLEYIMNIFKERMFKENLLYENTRIVPRVGYDVKASCGMFIGKDHE